MPNRILRDGILSSLAVNALSMGAEVFYRRLMSVVDDYGRTDAMPSLLRARCYPLRLDSVSDHDIEDWLDECCETSPALVVTYEVEGKQYLQVENFAQRYHGKSKYPPPPPVTGTVTEARPQFSAAGRNFPPPAANCGLDGDGDGCAGADEDEGAPVGTAAPVLESPEGIRGAGGCQNSGTDAAAEAEYARMLAERQANQRRAEGGMTPKPAGKSLHKPEKKRSRIPEAEQMRTYEMLRKVPGLNAGDARDLARLAPYSAFVEAVAKLGPDVRNVGGWLRSVVTAAPDTRPPLGLPPPLCATGAAHARDSPNAPRGTETG